MASRDDIKVRITADDSQFTATMSNLTQKAQGASSKISPLGAAVSGFGFAMGSAASNAGGLVSVLGNLAAVVGTTGALGAGIVGASLAFAHFTRKMEESKQKTKELQTASANMLKEIDKLIQERKYGGLSSFRIAAFDAAKEVKKLEKQLKDLEKARTETLGDKLVKFFRMIRPPDPTTKDPVEEAAKEALIRAKQLKEERGLKAEIHDETAEAQAAEKLRLAEVERDRKGTEKAEKERQDKRDAAAKRRAELEREEHEYRMWALGEETKREAELAKLEQSVIDTRSFMDKAIDDTRQAAWEEAVDNARVLAKIQEEIDAERLERLHNLGKTSLFWEQMTIDAAKESSHVLAQGIADYARLRGDMHAAQINGDKERYKELEKEERHHWNLVAASIAESLSQKAIGEGTILVFRGIGELALGNPGAAGAIGAGAALIAAGVAGTFVAGTVAGVTTPVTPAEGPDTTPTDRASDLQGPGVTEEGPTYISYYFGGPVFGQPDDAARAVAAFNTRGLALAGRTG